MSVPNDTVGVVPKAKEMPKNGYRSEIRMEGEMETFEANGGEEAFVKMLADSLGINPAYITINSVRVGSVIVEFDIDLPPNSWIEPEDLHDIMVSKIASKELYFRMPILDVET